MNWTRPAATTSASDAASATLPDGSVVSGKPRTVTTNPPGHRLCAGQPSPA
jgi:hypothetical protein